MSVHVLNRLKYLAKIFCIIDYTGDSCELLRDHCRNNICENGGICETIPGGFLCSCKDGMI